MVDSAQAIRDERLLQQIAAGDTCAMTELLTEYRVALRRMIELRLDEHIQSRVDASDVIQETQIEVARRIDDFLTRRPMPVGLWLRKTAYQCLLKQRRHHVADMRSVKNEERLPDRSSILLARHFLNRATPSQAMMKAELIERVQAAINELPNIDRELILMRNYEELTNTEAAALVDLSPEAAGKRYTRALMKLRGIIKAAESER
ncbi:MAG: sigma-70 family RNA polymerase sigma factor [Planctomycetaceae bacterium]